MSECACRDILMEDSLDSQVLALLEVPSMKESREYFSGVSLGGL